MVWRLDIYGDRFHSLASLLAVFGVHLRESAPTSWLNDWKLQPKLRVCLDALGLALPQFRLKLVV